MGMATQVLIAHTGQRLQIDTTQFLSLDDFKASVARQSSIPAQCIITLTPQGRPLKFQTIQTEREIYVYDNRLTQPTLSGTSPLAKSELMLPKRYTVTNPPNHIEDSRSVQSWQELFKARRAWALKVLEDCKQMAIATQDRVGEMDVMFRCLEAAMANLVSVIKNLEGKHAELQKWVPDVEADYTALTTGWEQYLSLARSVPISTSMVRFMTGRDMSSGKGRSQRQATLEDLVDLDTARKAGRLAPSTLRKFKGRVADLEKVASRLFQDADLLFREYERTSTRSDLKHDGESLQLLEDIEAVAKKIDTDHQTTMDYSNSTRDVLQASKIAANHTERLLPSINNRAREMDEMLQNATQSRNNLAAESIEFMRSITEVTSLSHNVKGQVNSVSQEDELATFDYLRLIQQVPWMYASFVAEAIKRREWLEKVKQDSTTLANEMAVFQNEEIKRRRRWHKAIGDAYGPETPGTDGNVPGLEVNLLGEEEQWPTMSRKDLDDFFEILQKQKAESELIADIGKLISELNNPTKHQSKRLNAFKNGSVHEAALGRSGLLIRGDDDLLRSLQDDKSKMESKLKTAESRVRRLEDLLHRQSQASRPSLGTLFQAPSQQGSERNDSLISVRPPRASEDRRRSSEGESLLSQRVQQLENELNAERERCAVFEKDLDARTTQHNDIRGQMEEANSTKKDLLENMEALKREFMEERKALEDEVKRLQARLEDTEDEIEHFGESRENEKATYDERLRSLEMENERLSKEKHDEALKTEGQVEFLRKETRLQRERVESLEKQLQASQEEASRLAKRLGHSEDTGENQLRTLRDVYEQLSPNEAIPSDLNDLIEGLLGKTADFLTKVHSVEGDMTLIKSDLELAQINVRNLRAEMGVARDKLSEREVTEMHLREELAQEKARAGALENELTQGREQLNELRVKIADGETGSESLRKKLEEEEARITSMTEKLASRQSQVGSLEEELLLFKERVSESQSKLADLSSRFDARTEHAKDLTQRLYSQNDRLCRLLERLGFSVAREGGSMLIQKVSRLERSSQNANDLSDPASSSLRKSGTLNSRVLADSADLELLYWMNAPDMASESGKYKSFLSALGSFDTDAFAETVYKRVKDIEHMARKLQRDSRAYREKAHTLQKDAHDKIAFKNFKEGDLALFLPTRNQTTGAWAAFNVGFPHYFLREQEGHRLRSREWLVARISKIQERVVDLSKSLQGSTTANKDGSAAVHETDSINEEENDNPFDLSDGLRWYLIDALEDKPGAPSTPGLGKSTVAANKVDAMADMHTHNRTASKGSVLGVGGRGLASSGIEGVSKSLSKSLESRRSSTGSRKALPFAIGVGARGRDSALASETNSLRAAPADTPVGGTSPTQHHHAQHLQHHLARPQTPLSTAHGVGDDDHDGANPGEGNRDGNGSSPRAADDNQAPTGRSAQQGGSEATTPRRHHLLSRGTGTVAGPGPLQREVSATSVESPSKKSVVWDSLWSLDVSYEGGRKGK